jgi:nucleotide-binding universal stress UspA family protein
MDFSSILVPVSGSSSDKHVVELACKLLNSSDSHLFILYIIEINRSLPIDATLTPEVARGDNILKSMETLAEKYNHQVTAELLQAREVGYAIVQEAHRKKVDGIAMTIPDSTKFGRFELEKTVTYVLKNAGCKIVLWND